MNKKELIGRKVKGFKFEPFRYDGINFSEEMYDYIGTVGVIHSLVEDIKGNVNPKVRFNGVSYTYPASLIERHLIPEELPEPPKEIDLSQEFEQGEMILVKDNESDEWSLREFICMAYEHAVCKHVHPDYPPIAYNFYKKKPEFSEVPMDEFHELKRYKQLDDEWMMIDKEGLYLRYEDVLELLGKHIKE